jgi:hypothetical protein
MEIAMRAVACNIKAAAREFAPLETEREKDIQHYFILLITYDTKGARRACALNYPREF